MPLASALIIVLAVNSIAFTEATTSTDGCSKLQEPLYRYKRYSMKITNY